MRVESNQIRAMPLHMQEQVAMAFVAQPAKANQVAVREEKPPTRKVHIRRLRFKSARAARRYLQLRQKWRNEAISDLVLHLDESYVICRFTYTVMEEY